MAFPFAITAVAARRQIERANQEEIGRRLRHQSIDPAWICDNYHPEVEALRQKRPSRVQDVQMKIRWILVVITLFMTGALVMTIATGPHP